MQIPRAKHKLMLEQVSATSGEAIVSGPLDTNGYRFARISVACTTAATNKAPSVLKLAESDDTTTTVTDISGFVGGTDFTIPTPEGTQSDGTGKPYIVFDVNLKGRKRYLRFYVTPTTTQTYVAEAQLYKATEVPSNNTEGNVRGYVAG